jgi:U1 small nuclear ribonucleoprotein
MLLQLFAPRPPLRWVEPSDHAPEKRQTPNIGGIAQYMQALNEYKDNDGYVPSDSWLQKRDRRKLEKKERQEKLLTEGVKDCTASPTPAWESSRSVIQLTSVQTNLTRIQRSKATPSRRFLFRA